MAKKIDHRGRRGHKELWFFEPIPEDNKKSQSRSSKYL